MPFLGFLGGSLFGRFIGNGVVFYTAFNIIISFLLSLYTLISIVAKSHISIMVFSPWLNIGSLEVEWGVYVDSLTAIMLVVVTFISSLVHIYSGEYMQEDPHLPRFMSYLSLFTFFMLILVTASNFLQLFVGWEGVGLSSYLLINFWYTRIQANKSAIKAMLLNRIGDFFLLLAIFTIYYIFDTLDYAVVFSTASLFVGTKISFGSYTVSAIDFICLCLFLGAMGKSAQIGLHTWLPDAMEGPTPVSALIHAATMVTAGVFLVVRCSYLFELSPVALNFMAIVGSITAFFGATIGLFQNDIKKIIAYSTCSQLGYMIFACGLSSYNVAMFHLSNHAVFKALLFLGAGSIIHAMADEQDIRRYGGLLYILPLSYSFTFIGSVALLGIPFFSGFYSKDLLLEVAYASQTTTSLFCYILGTISAMCTAFYSTRLIYLVFLANPNSPRKVLLNASEGGWKLVTPLMILAFFSLIIGYLTQDLFVGFGTGFWQAAIFILPENYNIVDAEFIPLFPKLLPLIFTLTGVFAAFFLCTNSKIFLRLKENDVIVYIYTFLLKKWYWDRLYNSLFSIKFLEFGYFYTYQDMDRGWIEKFGPYSISNSALNVSNRFASLQVGNIYLYLMYFLIVNIFIGLIFFFAIFFNVAFGLLFFISYFLINSLKTPLFQD